MNRIRFLLLIVTAAAHPAPAASSDADARVGADFFRTQMCVNCHAIRGEGATKAPDLGRHYDRNYTPAGIAAQMWNHAPTMWAQMSERKIRQVEVDSGQAASLFAFFYSAGYFEKPGDAGRGKRVFQLKHCIDCHAVAASGGHVGPPVEQWASLTDPVVLVERMWNHADAMKGQMVNRNMEWPQLSSPELDDLMVYLHSLPQKRSRQLEFSLPSQEGGAALFEQKGCANCHSRGLALENRLGDSTLTDVAAALWNHTPQMQEPHPELTLAQMRQILGYVWTRQFFSAKGDAAGGRQTFQDKKCAVCHNDPSSGAPALLQPSEPYSAIGMVVVLWKHGPGMLRRMQEKGIAWPQLSQTEMVNLIAYLNSRESRSSTR
jgi:mono/diheme cytochrome c family protein